MKKILSISIALLAVSIIPSSFAWDGLMAMDADKRNVDLGQIITYEGYLYGEEPIAGEIVSITVFEKETKEIILKVDTIPEPKSGSTASSSTIFTSLLNSSCVLM